MEDKFNDIDLDNLELNAVLDDDDAGEEAAELYEHYRVVADKGQQLLRVDKFLLDHLKDTSRNRIQAAAKAGFIHVNERPVKSNYRVKPFDVVTGIKPAKIPSLYSDYNLIIGRLNSAVKKCKSKGMENKFLEMFYLGTKTLAKDKFKM